MSITRAQAYLSDPLCQRALRCKLTKTEFDVWTMLVACTVARFDILSNNDIAAMTGLSKNTVWPVLQNLEHKRFIKRTVRGRGPRSVQIIEALAPEITVDRATEARAQHRHKLDFNAVARILSDEIAKEQASNLSKQDSTGDCNANVESLFERFDHEPHPEVCSSVSEVTAENRDEVESLEKGFDFPQQIPEVSEIVAPHYKKLEREEAKEQKESRSLRERRDGCAAPSVPQAAGAAVVQEAPSEPTPPSDIDDPGRSRKKKADHPIRVVEHPTPAEVSQFMNMSLEEKRKLVNSRHPAHRERRNQLLAVCGGILKRKYVQMRMKRGHMKWFANGKWDPSFIVGARLCIQYDVKFDDWLEFLYVKCPQFMKGVRFPPATSLASESLMEQYLLTDQKEAATQEALSKGAGFSYKHMEDYDEEAADLLLRSGLEMPPEEPRHLRGRLISDIEFYLNRLPNTAGLTYPYHPHTCLLAAHKKPDALRDWVLETSCDQVIEQWADTVAIAEEYAPKSEEMAGIWLPLLEVAAEISRSRDVAAEASKLREAEA